MSKRTLSVGGFLRTLDGGALVPLLIAVSIQCRPGNSLAFRLLVQLEYPQSPWPCAGLDEAVSGCGMGQPGRSRPTLGDSCHSHAHGRGPSIH